MSWAPRTVLITLLKKDIAELEKAQRWLAQVWDCFPTRGGISSLKRDNWGKIYGMCIKSWVPRRGQIESDDCPSASRRARGHPMTSAAGRLQINKKMFPHTMLSSKRILYQKTLWVLKLCLNSGKDGKSSSNRNSSKVKYLVWLRRSLNHELLEIGRLFWRSITIHFSLLSYTPPDIYCWLL